MLEKFKKILTYLSAFFIGGFIYVLLILLKIFIFIFFTGVFFAFILPAFVVSILFKQKELEK